MADALKAQFGLTALKISLTGGGSGTMVQVEFQRSTGGITQTESDLAFDPSEFGLPSRLEGRAERSGEYQFRLPEGLGKELGNFLGDQSPGMPLWIHLARPYGYLAAIPWESLLAQHVGIPVLRLPDFIFDPPKKAGNRLDVAICASVPSAKAIFDARDYVGRLLDAYTGLWDRRLALHVFTDQGAVGTFQGLTESPSGAEIRVYDPADSASLTPPPGDGAEESPFIKGSGEVTSPWLRWMQGSKRKVGFDVVHFACHGYLSTNQGYLALAESPTLNQDHHSARFVGSAELNTFLNRVGAWATGFTSPDQNYSPIGLRLLADAIVRTRPGPMLLQAGVLEDDWQRLPDVLRFLYAPEPSMPPPTSGFFVSCQPSRVRELVDWVSAGRGTGVEPPPPAPTVEGISPPLGLEELLPPEGGEAPAWLSSAARYLEQQRWQIDSERTASASEPMSEARKADLEAAERAIRKLEKLIHKTASLDPSHGPGSSGEGMV